MKLTEEEKIELEKVYQAFLNDEKILKMQEIPMHRGSNCYLHSFKVAKRAIRYAERSHKKDINFHAILLGAILHDYYLYDWRSDRSKKKRHGRNHPQIASENAFRDFNISKEVRKIIESHMWPINIKEYPESKEAKIVSICDKAVTIKEVSTSKAYKEKRKAYYLSYISKLFK